MNQIKMTTVSRRTSAIIRPGEHVTDHQIHPEFDTLFQEHWTRVCTVIYHIVGDWAEAEDLAVETFMQLYRRPPRHSENLNGWLYRVATNLGYNALRARRRRASYETQSGIDQSDHDVIGDPPVELERSQEREFVRTALANLKPRSAQLLVLRQAGFSYDEIAQSLSIAPGSVGTLLARAENEFERAYRKIRQD